ncbi:MAG: TIGR03663 family protein [Dehalococcoidia bacterium]|nr:MAG: TIGR03663 family protein [Dehalococcoidia bacterium]
MTDDTSMAPEEPVAARRFDAGAAWRRVLHWRPDRVEGIVLAIGLVALVTRFVGLDVRALHHDESLHATFSWYLAEGRGYRHDPLTHGPFQFHITALSFLLFGDSDVTARVPAACFGTALVIAPLLLRRTLGGVGTVSASLLFTVSPSLMYYSRFAREDSYVAFFLFIASAAVWRYLQEGQLRWIVTLTAALAFAFCTKETTYIYVAMLLLYLNAAAAHRLFWQAHAGERVSRTQWARGLLLVPFAWLILGLWDTLAGVRARLRWEERPREGDLLILVGTITLPLLAALVSIPAERLHGGALTGDLDYRVRVLAVGLLLIVAAWVGTGWKPGWWLIAAGTFLAVTVPLFTTGFTHPERIWGLPWDSLHYWLEQHGVRRGEQPKFYYLMMVPLYEMLALLPALIAAGWFVWKRDAFAIFVGWWFLGSFVALSYAGEKMPWLTVHLAIPLALLAAYGLGRAIPAAVAAARAGRGHAWAWAASGLAASAMLVLLAFAVDTDIGLNHRHPDTAVEPLIYVQTTPQLVELSREVHHWLEDGRATQVFVDQTDSLTWPWAWYLRDVNVRYADAPFFNEREWEPGTILIVARGTVSDFSPSRRQFLGAVVYRHRWWFVEEGYRATTWRSFASGMADGSLPRRWIEFARHRTDPDSLGALEGEAFFPLPVGASALP